MRIALVDPSLFTLPYDQALAAGLGALDHDVTLYGRRLIGDEVSNEKVRLNPQFYRVSESKVVLSWPRAIQLALKGVDHIASMRRLLRSLRQQPPDVIHFQWLPLPLADRHLLEGFRQIAPLVLTVHDTNPFNGAPSAGLQSAGMAKCLPMFDRLIVHTRQGISRLRAQGLDPARLVLVPHGSLERHPVEVSEDQFDGRMTLLLFGRIKPYKGLDILIEAFAQLPPSMQKQAQIRVVGRPFMDLDPLLSRVRTLGLEERFELEARFVPDTEVPALFSPGTIVVFPYREIEASGVLSLALAHGRPVIATALGSFSDILCDGKQGLLVPPNDAPALAEALSRMIGNRPFAAQCAIEARALSLTIPSWEDIGRDTTAVYREAIESKPARLTPA
jgi:glycosyltransferase involved in cell wall biosynthesis